MSKFLIPLPDFNRIHQVAHGVITDIGTAERGCTFFSIFGAYVLSQKYGIDARPVAGGFSLCVAGHGYRGSRGDRSLVLEPYA